MGAPFSVAILFKVAMAFSWFPDSTSYLALSGSHYEDRRPRCGQLGQNRMLGHSHTLSYVCVESLRPDALGPEAWLQILALPLIIMAL